MMNPNIFVYKPTDEILDLIEDIAEFVTEWSWNGDKEILFNMNTSLFKADIYHDLYMLLNKDGTESVVSAIYPKQLKKSISTGKCIEDPHRMSDLEPDMPDICEIIRNESPGGDIRKYLTRTYGGCKYSIDFKHGRSRNPKITSFEPMSMDTIIEFLDMGVLEQDGLQKNQDPYYPPASRILTWDQIVNDTWDLETRATGAIHFSKNNNVSAGLEGFIIYDADQEVKEWCDERWHPDNNLRRNEVDFPYMCPDEYDLYDDSQPDIPRSVIRMWWD